MGKFILIGEDDEFFGKLLKSKLTNEGFDVEVAKNGDEVLEKAKSKKPDLILLDLIMPKKDGFETLKELKLNPLLKDIKVIISSNLSQKEDLHKVEELGANGYVSKEDLHSLINTINNSF